MKKVKYWENRTPPPEYFAPVSPSYRKPPSHHLNHVALSRYAKKIGKEIVDMSREEIAPFFSGVPYGENADGK